METSCVLIIWKKAAFSPCAGNWSALSPEKNMPMNCIRRFFFLEFMIWLNRALINNHVNYLENEVSNEKITAIIDYINSHMHEEVTVDDLADHFL